MSYTNTKTITVDIDWLSEIDGRTVESAIKYLQTLVQDRILSCYLEGDTHGCELVSNLQYEVPMTNSEILSKLERHYLSEIALYEKAKKKHIEDGRHSRVESCDINLIKLRAKLEDARKKYGK